MSNFFDKSDLSRKDADKIVSDTLQNCDDGELYLEDTKSESILLDDNKIKSSSYSSDLGFGFRAITGEVVAYSHSNEISKDSLKKSSENLKSTLKSMKGTYNHDISRSNKKFYEDINPLEQKTLNSKLEVLNKVNEYLRKKDNSVKQVTTSFAGEQKSIEIIRSGGEVLTDVRPLIRFNVSVMLEKNGRKETGVYGIGGRQSYDEYLKNDNWKTVCEEAFRIASVNLESKPAPAGEMKVVLGPGWPAILIHEAIGHGLEGDFNRKKTSAFHDLMGQKVASEGVTIVDDGSTDGSGDLVEAIYGNNSRVKLLRKRNGGCASARNFGRRHSSASHIAFVDADDRVDSSMFTSLLEVARYTGAFVVEGEFKTFVRDENGADEFELSYEAVSYQSNGRHGLSDIEYDWIPGSQIIVGQPTIWRRIHRRDFLDRKDVWFPEHVRAFDDQIFQVYVGVYAGAIAHVRGQFYHYRQHPAQDIRQGDERHFYSFNMFRTILLRSLDEGWSDVFPILQSLINTMAWSYSGLRDDLKPIYSDAAVEFLAVYEMTFGEKVPKRMLERTGIPGLSFLVPLRVQKMAAKQVSYGMMRLESWRWQPEFIRMMVKALE